jgi:adenosylhomocysteine nucleosidase
LPRTVSGVLLRESVLAIVSAMQEEIEALLGALADVVVAEHGRRRYYRGTLHGVSVVAVFSRWGKVAAAATVTELISSFEVTDIVFSGVAGAIDPALAIGDVVIGTRLIQHDLDASPIFARYEVPLLGKAVLAADRQISRELLAAARGFIGEDLAAAVTPEERARFRIGAPKILAGLIGSGDKFFASRTEIAQLRGRLPEVLCVEMEGAAVAQVCEEYGVRFGVLRTISDAADENSVHDFPGFLREVAGQYSAGILRRFLQARARQGS